jgi:hypothetical protein
VKLLRATFLSIRGLPDLTCDFTRASHGTARDIVAVTGRASSGKTRLLEAIIAAKEVIAPYGPLVQGEQWIRVGEYAAKIELTFALDEDEQRRVGGTNPTVSVEALFGQTACTSEADDGFTALLERYEHDARFGKLDYFPANRGIPPAGPMHGLAAFEQRLYRLTRDPRKYSFVPRLLYELAMDPARAARFSEALARLCPDLRYVGSTGTDPVRCLSSRGSPALLPTELSTTEADALVFAATATLLTYERSIVLIDRPELSADERSIEAWLTAVRALATDVQLIVATSSPALLSSLEAGAIVSLDG